MKEKPRVAIHRAGRLSLQAFACLMLLSLPASAGDPLCKIFGCPVPDCIGKWCPDDYCAKKEPCVGAAMCFECDDYCSKKAPCVCTPLRFCCDDYCKKCPPKVCRSPQCQYLTCGTPCRQSGCEHCGKLPCDAFVKNLVETEQPSVVGVEEQSIETHRIEAQSIEESSPTQPIPPVFVRALDMQIVR